jgi:endo-1,4-beta-xylanase
MKGRKPRFVALLLTLLLMVPGGLGGPAAAAEAPDDAAEAVIVYHETFVDGQGLAVQAGSPSVQPVTGKAFPGNEDGAALYVSNRQNNWDGVDFPLADVGMKNGKTYTITIHGYVDEDADIPAGAQAWLQNVDSYGWIAGADFVAGQPFTLTGQYTADTGADRAIRVQSSDAGKTVPFYIGEVVITTTDAGAEDEGEEPARDPALPFATITFEDGTTGGFEPRGGVEKLTVTDEANHTDDGKYALKVEGRQQDWQGPSLRIEKYVDKGSEYTVTAWVKLISPGTAELQLSTQIGNSSPSYQNITRKTVSVNDGWVKLEGTYRYASVGDEFVTIYVETTNNPEASFYIDDISFVATGSGPVEIEKDLKPIKDVYKDDFLIGNIMNASDFDGVRLELLKMHHNVLTAENAMKPEYAYNANRELDFADEDALVEKAIAEGFSVIGHVLVWHQQSPEWLWQNEDGTPLSKEEALANLRYHVKETVRHFGEKFGDNIISWDVVNEAMNDNPANPEDWRASLRQSGWYQAIGPDYIEEAFLAAKEVLKELNLNTKLYYNDYNDDNQNKATAIYHMVKELNEKYAAANGGEKLIDGIGMQGHYNQNTNPANVKLSIERFASLGVEISITELDITDNQDGEFTEKEAIAQGYLYAELFNIFKAHKDSIARVTFWGLNDASSWRSNGFPLLFDRNMKAKKAYYAVIDPAAFLAENELEKPKSRRSYANYGTPVIDGVEDDAWTRAPELPIDQFQQAWHGATGTAKVLWDEQNLYVLIHVLDDELDVAAANAWEQDSVEVFLDENNAKSTFYQADDGQYRVNYENETSFNPAGIDEGFESAVKVDGTNYTVEIKIPFKTVKPSVGMHIGFDVQINDGRSGSRESVAIWNDLTGQGWQDPSVYGELLLIDGPVPAFDRVPEGHWAKTALDVLFALGLLDEGTGIDPSAAAGKAEFASLLTRVLGLASDESLFDGVQENAEGSLSREGMMVMVDRALEAAGKGLTGQDSLAAFSDADAVSDQARASAAKLVAGGILHGKNGKLAPQEPLTKAQAAVIVYQLLSK